MPTPLNSFSSDPLSFIAGPMSAGVGGETLNSDQPSTNADFADVLAEADVPAADASEATAPAEKTATVLTAEQIAVAMAFYAAPVLTPSDAAAPIDGELSPSLSSDLETTATTEGILSAPDASAGSARTLLAQGATQLEYQVAEGKLTLPAPNASAVAAASTSAADPEAVPAAALSPETAVSTAPAASADSQTQQEAAQASATVDLTGAQPMRVAHERAAAIKQGEKFAVTPPGSGQPTAFGGKSSEPNQKNTTLVLKGERVTEETTLLGTDTANRGKLMNPSASNAAPQSEVFGFASHVAASMGTSSVAAPAVDAPSGPAAAHAPQLVKEIHEIADSLSSIERNSVEVGFTFGEAERLSVRVEYREGTVHTTFRTDSPGVRDALAREWQIQGVALDRPSYRVAEPVFSPSSQGNQQGFSSSSDGSGHQRTSEQPAPSSSFVRSGTGRSSISTTHGAGAASHVVRPETSRHLHALA